MLPQMISSCSPPKARTLFRWSAGGWANDVTSCGDPVTVIGMELGIGITLRVTEIKTQFVFHHRTLDEPLDLTDPDGTTRVVQVGHMLGVWYRGTGELWAHPHFTPTAFHDCLPAGEFTSDWEGTLRPGQDPWPAGGLAEKHPGIEDLVHDFSRYWRQAMRKTVGRNPRLAQEMRVAIGPEPETPRQWRALTAAARGYTDLDGAGAEDAVLVPMRRRELNALVEMVERMDYPVPAPAAHELLIRDLLRALQARLDELGPEPSRDQVYAAVDREHEFHARLRAVIAYAARWRSGIPDGETDEDDDL